VPLRPVGGRESGYAAHLAAVDRSTDLHGLIHEESAGPGPIGDWAAATGKPIWETAILTRTRNSIGSQPPVAVDANDIAALQLTSGSTRDPKAVIVTHGMIADQIDYLVDSHRRHTGHAPRALGSWVPAYHDAGLFFGILLPLALGCDHVLASPEFYMRRTRRWFQLMSEHHVEANFATNSSAVAACKP